MKLRDDPFLLSPTIEAAPYHKMVVVSLLENSIDGSGCWFAVHLLNRAGVFIQGGWIRGVPDK
jgi:hypothetical protein